MFTKEQALAIDVAPSIVDTADAEIFYWQLTGKEWDGTKSSYHSQATQRWRKLRRPPKAVAAARAADAAQKADARRELKWAEGLNIDVGLSMVKMVAILIEHVSRHFTVLSDDICSCHSILLDLIEEVEWQQSLHPRVA